MSSSSLNLSQTTPTTLAGVTPANVANQSAQLIPQNRLWPITVEQYHQIAEHGIIHEDEPVELLEGLLFRKGEYFPQHRNIHSVKDSDGKWLIPIEKIYPLSVEQYHRMAEVGILKDGDPVELLEGRLIKKMTKNRRHSHATSQLRRQLEKQLTGNMFLDSQEPVELSGSEPEPDLIIVRGDIQRFSQTKPAALDVPLLIEVSDSTLAYDQNGKLRLYAAGLIAHYWIVNLIDNRIEWYSEPSGGVPETASYRQHANYPLGSTLVFPLDGVELRVVVDEKLIPLE